MAVGSHAKTTKSREKWWEKYRSIKHRARHQLTFDRILWKSIRGIMKEYVKQSSLSGIKYLFGDGVNKIQRLKWAVLIAFSCVIFGFYVKYVVLDNISNPLIVTLASSTYPISEIDFPAVAICNINRISKNAAEDVAREIHTTSPYFRNTALKDIEEFVHQTGRLLDFKYDDHFAERFADIINSPNRATFDSDRIVKRMEQLAPNCSAMLVKCAWARNVVVCTDVFTARRTARGHCCVFNYVLEYNSAGSKDSTINTLDSVKKQKVPGRNHGLAFILDLLTDDYAYPILTLEGFEIFMFDATYYPDPSTGRVVHRMAQANELLYYELKSTKQEAAPEVRKYPSHIRKCLFRDERPENFKNMYSYSACLVQCRIRTFLKLCRCIPYFLPTEIKAPVCTLDDLHCLYRFKEKFFYLYPRNTKSLIGLEEELHDSLDCPECLADCEFTRYDTKSYWTPLTMSDNKGIEYFFRHDINMTNKCMVTIYQPNADGVLDILDVVSYWYEILSNLGGLAGMLVGFSLLCVVELVYYLIRFFVALCKNYKMYH